MFTLFLSSGIDCGDWYGLLLTCLVEFTCELPLRLGFSKAFCFFMDYVEVSFIL